MSDPIAYNAEARAAAERARNAPGTIRANPTAERRRHRVVYDRETGEHRVIAEAPHDPVPDEVTTALVHEIQCGRQVAPPEWFTADQVERFWLLVGERRR